MALDPVRRADDEDGHVHHPDGPLRFAGKVRVAGRIQEGEIEVPVGKNGLLGKDGDAPFLFLGVGIQPGVPVVHPPLAAQGAGDKEQGFGQGGLARVHMGDETDDGPMKVHVHTPREK